MLPDARLKSWEDGYRSRCECRESENKTAVCPYCPDQAVGVFFVPEQLNNYMLDPLEAAIVGVFTLGFITAYGIMYSVKIIGILAKYFKGIKK